jgi:hypothetical protein
VHGFALATDLQAIAVVLDLMHPVRPDGRPDGAGGDARRMYPSERKDIFPEIVALGVKKFQIF